MKTVTWLNHEFGVYIPDETTWNDVAGIYIFTGLVHTSRYPSGAWKPYYIGKATSFKYCLPDHEAWYEAVPLGATHVHAMVAPLEASRDTIEQQLIEAYQPVLNVQLK
jgi:hypothetical protein